ncbi:Pentatricopeptide repeat-containing protein [Abeliophyllum distichum]|uniref:Pentatricopeptide repeat-containing protein n=1 Tax=Abeliophyllum distichum TaxID=126358 RepID=A0ABD1PZY1_9LAMI
MYAKCGYIESASQVFGEMKEKSIRTWSVMIWGWGIHGHVEKALRYFEMMKLTGVKPDEVAFLAILTACSHAGQVDQGLQLFVSMKHENSVQPTMKHYAIMVDLFGRAGQLKEALSFIQSMPMDPDFVIWGSLFCACRAHKNIEMAKFASEKLLQLEPNHPGSYVFLSNVYAGIGRWEDVETVRISMKDRGVDKDPGWSSIEVDGQVHNFVAGDHSHQSTQEIYLRLEEITTGARQEGYMPETEWVLHNIEEEEKEDALGSHSEKLALAFGLISTGPGTILRIVKNLRICGDCHSLMKHIIGDMMKVNNPKSSKQVCRLKTLNTRICTFKSHVTLIGVKKYAQDVPYAVFLFLQVPREKELFVLFSFRYPQEQDFLLSREHP